MISAEKIGELIKNPQLVQSASVADIAELKEKFAYCSSLHLLYLKGLAINNDVHFEDELRYAAAHVIDRERMYYLIHSGEEIQNSNQENSKPITEEIKIELPKLTTEKSTIEIPIKTEKKLVEPILTKIIPVEPNTKNSEEKIIEKSAEKDSPKLEEPIEIKSTKEVDDLIEATISATVIDALYEKELNTLSENQSEKITPKSTEKTEQKIQIELTKSEEKKIEKQTEPIQKSETKQTVDLSKLSFVEWLKYKQSQPTESTQDEKKEKTIASKIEGQPKQQEVAQPQKKSESISTSKSRVDDLLNKFIKEEPSISKPKSEFFSPTKTAKQSLEEAPDLVTETLAKIYVLQKNYSKAIQAYEQLILVYPEKKTFFVSLIEKIKKEQH